MIDKKIRSGTRKVDDYIAVLETELERRNTSGIEQLIVSSNLIAKSIAQDLESISKGTKGNLKVLSDDKDDKMIERILAAVGSVEKFKKIELLAKELDKEFLKEEVQEEIPEGTPESYVFKDQK